MKLKSLLIPGILGLSLAAGGVALAGPGGPGGGGLFGPHVMRILRNLDLNQSQRFAIFEMHDNAKTRRKAMREQRQGDVDAIAAELEKASPDPAKLRALADKRFEEMRAESHRHIDEFLKIHATLTPEQRKILAAELKKLPDEMRDRRGRGRMMDDDGPGPRQGKGGPGKGR